MVGLNGISVEILINNVPVREYDCGDDVRSDGDLFVPQSTETTKYIEVESGAAFSFKFDLGPQFAFGNADNVNFRISLDGSYLKTCGIWKNEYNSTVGASKVDSGVWNGQKRGGAHCDYYFADLETRDLEGGEDQELLKAQYANLGDIRIEVFRSVSTGRPAPRYKSIARSEAVPEKALKGQPLDLAVELRKTDGRFPGTGVLVEDLDDHPRAIFNLKYRTKRALQILGVIERSVSPTPIEDRPVEELSREELQDLVRRQRENLIIKNEVKKEKRGIKRESENTDSATRTPRKQYRTSQGENGRIVYHIDSDDENDSDDEVELVSSRNVSGNNGQTAIVL